MGNSGVGRNATRLKALVAGAVAVAVLYHVGCVYDYAALEGRKDDAAAGQTGGSTISISTTGGSPGGVTQTGGATMVTDPHSGAGGSSGPGGSSGGRGSAVAGAGGGGGPGGSSVGGGSATAGAGGTPPPATGGASGAGAGGTTQTGTGGAGGTVVVPRILSIDFVGGTTKPGSSTGGATGTTTDFIALPAMGAAEVAGVKPVANWNSAQGPMGQLTHLVQSDGTPTAATAVWISPSGASGPGVWRNNYGDAPGNTRMMNGYLDPLASAMAATVTATNLPPDMAAAGYDVYVYCGGEVSGGTRTYRYVIGASSITVTQTGPSPTTFTGFMLAPAGGSGNYIVFRHVMGSSFTLTAMPASSPIARAPVNGIQIVSPPGS